MVKPVGAKRKAADGSFTKEKKSKLSSTSTASSTQKSKKPSKPESDVAPIESGRKSKRAIRKPSLEELKSIVDMDMDGQSEVEDDEEEFAGFEPLPEEDSSEEGESTSKAVQSEPGKGSSSEGHAKQKALAKERKASRPNAELILRSKRIWEQLRRTSEVTPADRKKLVSELLEIITGRIHDFVFKHDSGRVIQCALKFAPKEQKLAIAQELKGSFCALAESKYAKFLIAKFMVYSGKEIQELIVSEFYGHVRKLINHPEAAWILDDIYRGAINRKQQAMLLSEWYGPEFALFKDSSDEVTADLKKILERTPEKRKPIMDHLLTMINSLVQKKKSAFTMLHDAMLQYFLNIPADSAETKQFIEMLQDDEEGDLLKNLAFTASGSRLVSLALARGSASNRKHIIRAYKGVIPELAYDRCGHLVLLAIYDVVDDTKMVAKSVFTELVGKTVGEEDFSNSVLSLAGSDSGRVALLFPLAGPQKWFLHQSYLPIVDEYRAESSLTSKKDADVRRGELVQALSPFLLYEVAQQADKMIETSFGCQCIAETLLSGMGDKAAAADAVAALLVGDPATEEDHPVNKTASSRMAKALVRGGRFDSSTGDVVVADPTLRFASRLWPVIRPSLDSWVTGKGDFVILNMLETAEWDGRDELVAALKAGRPRYEAALKAATSAVSKKQAGGRASAGKSDRAGTKDKKGGEDKKSQTGEARPGAAGIKLILDQLAAA